MLVQASPSILLVASLGWSTQAVLADNTAYSEISALMETVCVTEFAALAPDAPNVAGILSGEITAAGTPAEGVSPADFVRGIVFPMQLGAFLEAVDISNPEAPVLQASIEDRNVTRLRVLTDLASCLFVELGTVVNGLDVERADADVRYSEILRWSDAALAAVAEEN